ncbi:MAG: hypothetical protein KC616_05460 [Myxococcales bacterium]|nr:hypothetical protein [Myxococcales bacterium]
MARAWEVLDRRETADGLLELRRRAADDFLICVGGRVLMNSRASRSELELGVWTCEGLAERGDGAPPPRVLVAGLGMGLTLRAVLDVLPAASEVVVAELHPVVAEWCRGPLAALTDGAVSDARVRVHLGDVAACIAAAAAGEVAPFEAIVLDLFEGPHAKTDARGDPLYGTDAIDRCFRALAPGGALGVWGEVRDPGFESRLARRGFGVETRRPGRGGLRHAIVRARRPAS